MSAETKDYDVIVVGAGPAGLTAAIYSSWLGLTTLVLEASYSGGRAAGAAVIENYPGFEEGVKGTELVSRMSKQATRLGAVIKTMEGIVGFDLHGALKTVVTRNASYHGRVIVICTGTQRKKLLVPGEAEFLGRGVSYCSVCDGSFFRNARVAVVGGSKETLSDASHLVGIASHVVLVAGQKDLLPEGSLQKLLNKENFEVVRGKVVAIKGDKTVKSIMVFDETMGRDVEIAVNGVFVSLGGVPMTEIVKKAGVKVDDRGCIVVDRVQRTNIEGVFAAGDCTCGGMQVVTAAGEGAMAAMKASALIIKTRI